jgi:hypothetical protein
MENKRPYRQHARDPFYTKGNRVSISACLLILAALIGLSFYLHGIPF